MKAILDNGAELEIPFHASEVLWSTWSDFKIKENEYFQAAGKQDEEGVVKPDVRDATIALVEAVETICGEGVKLLKFSIGEEEYKLIDSGYVLKMGEEVTILKLYAHLVTVVDKFVPVDLKNVFRISIGNAVFQIDKSRAASLFGFDSLSVGEAIEILEFMRVGREAVKLKRVSLGNMDFSMGLRQIATILRKPGEELPWNKKELEDFLDRRCKVFEPHVTAEQILTLRFFLINSFIESKITLDTNSSSKDRRDQTTYRIKAIKQKKGAKRQKRRFI